MTGDKGSLDVRDLGIEGLGMIAGIDRSEHVDVEYEVARGRLRERPVSMTEIPPWDPAGTGFHSVAAQIEWCRDLVSRGAVLLGCFSGRDCAGVSVIDPSFEPGLAWLAFLYVSRPFRHRGVASALWNAAAEAAASAGSGSVYVSAVPTGSAVGFYLSRGCRLADPPHPALHAKEPDDVHLICRVGLS